MGKGAVWGNEWSSYRDMETGVQVTQLTNYKGHSHHLYFTNNGWYGEGKKLVFGSDRNNRSDLYSIDLRSGEIIQLTGAEDNIDNLTGCVNPKRSEAYYWRGQDIVAIDLDSLEERVLYKRPEGFGGHILSVTADGKYVCTSIHQQLSEHYQQSDQVDLQKMFAMKPLSQVIRVSTERKETEVVYENHIFMAHVNTSPTQAHLLTFCHEGPWDKVENRIWGLNAETGDIWMIRPRTVPGERIGHEYWHADGLNIGYHGARPNGDRFFGKVRYDNSMCEEESFPFDNMHVHSNHYNLIVGDGQPGTSVRLWKRIGTKFVGPRILCNHRGSAHVQKLHIHPRFDADGEKVLFTSDQSGYGNLYLAQIPDFDALPNAEEVRYEK